MRKKGFVHKNASLNYKLTVFLPENVKKSEICHGAFRGGHQAVHMLASGCSSQ